MSRPVQELRVQPNSVALIGFQDGSAGQIETWFETKSGYHIACFVHEAEEPVIVDRESENRKRVSQRTEFPSATAFKGRPLVVALDWPQRLKAAGIRKVLPLTPNNRDRLRHIELCLEHGFELVSAIHPTAEVLADARIEPGVWINAKCVIGYKAELAPGVILNTGAQVDHHNVLKTACQVDPGVVTAGFVTLERCCHIHTGAVIINRRTVGEDAVVGAGAVVIDDVPQACTVVGVPARVIKRGNS